jgi:nucleotide-binding universal stress UspA family protein
MDRITVGVDGSDDSLRGLAWAIDEARLRGTSLQMVHAYPRLEHSYPLPDGVAVPDLGSLPTEDEVERAKEAILHAALEQVGGARDLEVTYTVEAGSPTEVLCQAAAGADLLVVGARGLGGFRGLLVGSVSHQVVAHSPCPVVVVTPDER